MNTKWNWELFKQLAPTVLPKILLSVLVLGLVIFIVCNPNLMSQPEQTRSFLTQQGYTNIEITGYRWFAKSKDDLYVTGFTATNPSGNPVSGVVTSSPIKGKTIRFD